MSFEAFWKPFERIFQIFCVSHYSIYRPNIHKNALKSFLFRIYFVLFSLMHFSTMVYALNRGLHIEISPNKAIKQSPFIFYVNYMSTIGNMASHITAHLEALCMAKKEKQLIQELEAIDKIFTVELHSNINYDKIRKEYFRKTVAFFALITSMSVGSSFFSFSHLNANRYLFLLIRVYTVATIRSRGCYIALVLRNLLEFLKHLRDLLIQQQQNCRRSWKELPTAYYPMENIRFFRDIYTKIWIVKNLISDCFGWTLITFLTQFILDLINLSYWIYINFTVVESRRITIRKCSIFIEVRLCTRSY